MTTRGARFERDPDRPGSGFWWSMLHEIIEGEKARVVEQFSAPDRCVEWHHVFGPTQFHMDACCTVVPVGEALSCPRCPGACNCDPAELAAAAVVIAGL